MIRTSFAFVLLLLPAALPALAQTQEGPMCLSPNQMMCSEGAGSSIPYDSDGPNYFGIPPAPDLTVPSPQAYPSSPQTWDIPNSWRRSACVGAAALGAEAGCELAPGLGCLVSGALFNVLGEQCAEQWRDER